MRALLYAKDHYPYPQYEDAFGELWLFLWQEHKDVSKPDVLVECLSKHFKKGDAEKSTYSSLLATMIWLMICRSCEGGHRPEI